MEIQKAHMKRRQQFQKKSVKTYVEGNKEILENPASGKCQEET